MYYALDILETDSKSQATSAKNHSQSTVLIYTEDYSLMASHTGRLDVQGDERVAYWSL